MAVLLRLLPTFVCLVAWAAHMVFIRMPLFVLVVPFLLCVLFIPRGWVARFFQLLLALIAIQWVHAAVALAIERREAGEPWLRAVVILGAVAAFNLYAAWLFESEPLRDVYPRRR